MTEKKKMKILFDPGCFDGFEGTQEELDSLIEDIKSAVDDGSFFENSVPVDELDEETLSELMDMIEKQHQKKNTRQ